MERCKCGEPLGELVWNAWRRDLEALLQQGAAESAGSYCIAGREGPCLRLFPDGAIRRGDERAEIVFLPFGTPVEGAEHFCSFECLWDFVEEVTHGKAA